MNPQTGSDDPRSTRPSPEAVRRAVIEILAAQALREPSGLRAEDRIEDLGIDSLGMAEVIFAIEERFDVTVPLGAAEGARLDLDSVGAVCAATVELVCGPVPAL